MAEPTNSTYFGSNPTSMASRRLKEVENVIAFHAQNNRGLNLHPTNITFATQNPNESIFVFVRRHWIENLGWMIRNIIYIFIPFFIIPFLRLIDLKVEKLNKEIIVILFLCYYGSLLTNFMRDFFDWYFDPYIITNERVIHYEFKPFSKYEVQEASLDTIQKIQESASGLISGIFNFGTLDVTIEGPQEELILKNIPNQTKVRDILSDLTKVAKKYNGPDY